MSRPTTSTWAVAGIVALVISTVSVGATMLALAPARPTALGSGTNPTTFPLSTEDFVDQRTVDVTVNTTEGSSSSLPRQAV